MFMSRITLRPQVTFSRDKVPSADELASLHHAAHDECFIANSLKSEIAVEPVLQQIKMMHDKGRGVIGMKIYGNGTFTDVADRERSVKFAMGNPNIDAVVIGLKSRAEVDETIAMMNRALAA